MFPQVVWKGTEPESFELLSVIQGNCVCEFGTDGARSRVCKPHDALVHDQRFLDGLLFGRRIADRLRAEEWRAIPSRPLAGGPRQEPAVQPVSRSAH